MTAKSWFIALAALLAVAAGSYLGFLALRPEPLPEGFVYGNGHIEGTEVRVAAELPGRVVDNRMVEGQPVRRGDELITLDALATAESLRASEAEREALVQELAALEPQLANWRHHGDNAARELARLKDLRARGLATPQQLELAGNALSEAEGHARHLAASVESLKAKRAAADAQVAQSRDRLGKVSVRAPQDGTLLVKAVEAGEYVQPGQAVAILVDMARLELTVFVSARDLGRIAVGQEARVRVDAFPERYHAARVARIAAQAQFTPRDIHLPEERARMVYGVTLALANPDGRLKPGMPADAWLRWTSGAAWPDRLPVPAE
ncbi:MAG: HlyD family efflux transporter periplasmic adaptor subunit [Gammaproteobacteria bacterium]|nr:HlyD family efflux transporter periplasmic adaptor subunit [Gammaproteobacteria bacterium]